MPARDIYHDSVKNALIKDGWVITHDPYVITFGPRSVFVDLGAERMIAAEKDSRKIAVEVKTFQDSSPIHIRSANFFWPYRRKLSSAYWPNLSHPL